MTTTSFAAKLTASYEDTLKRTSISGALDFAARHLQNNGFTSNRQIIDISGDGPNNQGRPLLRTVQSGAYDCLIGEKIWHRLMRKLFKS